jgi:hypothetical protein
VTVLPNHVVSAQVSCARINVVSAHQEEATSSDQEDAGENDIYDFDPFSDSDD